MMNFLKVHVCLFSPESILCGFPCFLVNSPSSRGRAEEIKVGNCGGQSSLIFSSLQQRVKASREMHSRFTGVEMQKEALMGWKKNIPFVFRPLRSRLSSTALRK